MEVGNHSNWVVGVARKSAERKEDVDPVPSFGMWCLCHTDYEYTIYDELVEVDKNPETLRVQVDFDKGEVSFDYAEDMTHIHTHVDTFTEKLFPFFSFGLASDGETVDIRIRPLNFSVSVVKDGELQVFQWVALWSLTAYPRILYWKGCEFFQRLQSHKIPKSQYIAIMLM